MTDPASLARSPEPLAALLASDEWPAVGDVVVNWSHTNGRRMVVTKITATQVVCTANGHESRFRRKGLSRIGAGSWDGSTLIREDDPRFLAYEAHSRRVGIAAKVEDLMVRFRRDDDDGAAEAARGLLNRYLTKQPKVSEVLGDAQATGDARS